MKIRTIIAAAAAVGTLGGSAFAQTHYTAVPLSPSEVPQTFPGNQFAISWDTIEGGGGVLSGGTLSILATTGQADIGAMTSGNLALEGGFWAISLEPPVCYADCDESGGSPRLTANDLLCFVNRFAAADAYANCDGSVSHPVLNILDFQCFLMKFSAGCP